MKWTLLKASTEFNVERNTLRRRLRAQGITVGPKRTYTTRQLLTAIYTDYDKAHAEKEVEEARIARVEAELAEGNSFNREEVTSIVRDNFAPIREDVIALPGQLSALCNPADPDHARAHLEAWRDQFLKRRKEKIPERKGK
jgi:hypothetical protein